MDKERSQKTSIKQKVIMQVAGQVVFALLLTMILAIILVEQQMSQQTEALLNNKADALQQRIEQRIRYLTDNTTLLTKNELMVNALTDSEGRKNYLPPLVNNFVKGKDVLYINVVDYDGQPIYQSQDTLPQYNESSLLRNALALGQLAVSIDQQDKHLIVISPIEYYSTTQGAVIVVFDLEEVIFRNRPPGLTTYVRLYQHNQEIFVQNFDTAEEYRNYRLPVVEELSLFSQLGLELEIGLPRSEYQAPMDSILVKLLLLCLCFVLVSVFFAARTANKITQPILELSRRVKAASEGDEVLCSPLGSNDELEELAQAFDERTFKLQYQTKHDSLTDLPNRILFLDRLQQALKANQRHQQKLVVLFLDLDRFKEINDSFGHETGDELLRIVSERMTTTLRDRDSVARLSSDEFTLLLEQVPDDDAVIRVLQKVMQLFQEPFILDQHKLFITCSIGVAISPQNGESAEALLKNAHSAMYKAKAAGRNTYQFYTQDMTDRAYERMTLETDLRQAIEKNELEVFYQPQVNMSTGQILGMEALIRWRRPDGLVPPFKFIPLAEETGIIVELDRWVMAEAWRQFEQWQQDGLNPGVLSLNLSMIQLNHDDFITAVKQQLQLRDLPSNQLMFEMTETQMMQNPDRVVSMLEQLRALGVKLAIDDFGTGHSSLSYIKRLPVDKIKIDQSFVRDIPEDNDDMELTRAIIAMSHSLRLEVIAEGVETIQQAAFLQKHDCSEAQGYLYYKPMPAHEVTVVLHKKLRQKAV